MNSREDFISPSYLRITLLNEVLLADPLHMSVF